MKCWPQLVHCSLSPVRVCNMWCLHCLLLWPFARCAPASLLGSSFSKVLLPLCDHGGRPCHLDGQQQARVAAEALLCPAEFWNSRWQVSAPDWIIPAAAGNQRWLESCHPFGYANRELCRRAIWVLFYFCLISCQHVYTVQSLSLAIVLP